MQPFSDVEQVKALFPIYVTAVLHSSPRPISRQDAVQIHRAHRASVGVNLIIPEQIRNAGNIDLLELRGATLSENGVESRGNDTGAIYINHSYDNDWENMQDFSEGDIITVLYRNGKTKKFKNRFHPEYVYNHETGMLVRCFADFTSFGNNLGFFPYQVKLERREPTFDAINSIIFLHDAGLIARKGNQPRPVNTDLVNSKINTDPTFPQWLGMGFLKLVLFIIVALLLGILLMTLTNGRA